MTNTAQKIQGAAHTPGPWAEARTKDYPEWKYALSVRHEPSKYSHACWAGYIGDVLEGYAESESACWDWLERNAYFHARSVTLSRAALAKVQP